MKTIIMTFLFVFSFSLVQSIAQVPDINKSFQGSINWQTDEMYCIHLTSTQHKLDDNSQFNQVLQTFPSLQIIMKQGSDGWYRYYIGYITSVEEAFAILNQLKQMGFQSAYIQRISKKETEK